MFAGDGTPCNLHSNFPPSSFRRDELRMTLHAYQTLYESSIAFGIRKALQAEQGEESSDAFE